MPLGTAPGQFARLVDCHSIRRTGNAPPLAFRPHLAASHAGSLGNAFHAFDRFLGHLRLILHLFSPKRVT